MRILAWLIAAVMAVLVIAFAVANRGPVSISVDPLPFALDIPIWTLVIGALAVGFAAGALIRWLLDQRARGATRRRMRALEREGARLRERLDKVLPAGGGQTSRKDAA